MRRWHSAALSLLLGTGQLAAQGDCFPSASSNEARTFALLSVPLAFSGLGVPLEKGIALGLEGVTIPQVAASLATPTTCRPGKGPENTNPLPALARLRLSAALGAWRLEVGWIPPVRLAGVRANLVGIGLGRRVAIGAGWLLMPRAHVLLGSLRAPITCDDDALADPTSECFGGTRSDDRWRPGIGGVEVAMIRSSGVVRPHVGLGWSVLRPRFRVHFVNAQGEVDRRRISVDLSRVALFGGASAEYGRLTFSGELYGTVGDGVAVRIGVMLPLGASKTTG